jgi:two-component system, OmpR family, phosphate regulon sensor histidine kinase PhoR
MPRRKIIPDPIVIIVPILLVAGFQVYWLKNNYDREKKNLEVRTGIAFQETVRQLQAVKLKLKNLPGGDPPPGHFKISVNEDNISEDADLTMPHRQEIITLVKAIRDTGEIKRGVHTVSIISSDGKKIMYHSDSVKNDSISWLNSKNNKFFEFLSDVDSLQDSIKLPEITAAYSKRLKRDKINIPFTINKIDSAVDEENLPDLSIVVVGFKNAKTYKLVTGNSFPYLLKKIITPIIFSFLLVGFTIFSFIVLYRNLAKQRRLAQIKNEFISNITHELKTPIATVSVAIEALRNFDAMRNPEKTKEYLDISAAELQRLGLLVDKVLKLSMLENKTLELKKEAFNLRSLVDEVVQIMKLQFGKSNAKVGVTTAGDNFTIEADRLHITSVLYNLIDNALKYSGPDPAIMIKLSSLPENMIELQIEDNGPGIAKEYQSRIFEKFFRITDGDKHNTKGYGLGLSYVKEIITHHKGQITFNTETGKGCTFIIKLPGKAIPVLNLEENRKIVTNEIQVET